ncbi:MAG: hypothetical protein WCO99_14995, partial [Planctomycetota bacterium]
MASRSLFIHRSGGTPDRVASAAGTRPAAASRKATATRTKNPGGAGWIQSEARAFSGLWQQQGETVEHPHRLLEAVGD